MSEQDSTPRAAAEPVTEQERHKAAREAGAYLETVVLGYAADHAISDIDMLAALNKISGTLLRYLDRDDEERRTGFRHRLAGE